MTRTTCRDSAVPGWTNTTYAWKYFLRLPEWEGLSPFFLSVPLLVIVVTVTAGSSLAQTPANLFGASTPAVVGNPSPVVLGVKIFSDVPGLVLGCSFYKAPANIGVHVVSLWDSAGRVLATQVATAETASGKQSVLFESPVSIASKQTVTCGYFAPQGHYSYNSSVFQIQKDVSPLHVPVNGGMYAYGTQSTTLPTSSTASSFWVDVSFAPSTGSTTWIGGVNVSPSGSGASVTWNTAVPADSQVDYRAHQRLRRHDSLGGSRSHRPHGGTEWPAGRNHLSLPGTVPRLGRSVGPQYRSHSYCAAAVSVSISPSNATVVSSATQQLMALVSNTANVAVTWSATAGTVNSSGLFTAPPCPRRLRSP